MITFSKMHGLGNDFVMIDRRTQTADLSSDQIRLVCDRHFGVGCDLLCFIDPSPKSAAKLSFFNADASPAQACGNATRCAARLIGGDLVEMDGPVGPLKVAQPSDGLFSINMGQPETRWDHIPLTEAVNTQALPIQGTPSAISIGNPHLIFHVDQADQRDPAKDGPTLERHPLFPDRTNVEFASLIGPNQIRMRVWERGCGVTKACGSGACATLVSFHNRGLVGRRAELHLDGGVLDIDWREDGIWMTGPATHVCDGTLAKGFLEQATVGGAQA